MVEVVGGWALLEVQEGLGDGGGVGKGVLGVVEVWLDNAGGHGDGLDGDAGLSAVHELRLEPEQPVDCDERVVLAFVVIAEVGAWGDVDDRHLAVLGDEDGVYAWGGSR